MRQRGLLLAVTLIATLAAGSTVARATTLEPIAPAGTYSNPLFVTSEPTDPPNPNRLLIVEQNGTIELTEGATTTRFLDISDRVTPGGEEGLLSMAFAPDYETSKRFFVFYVDTAGDLQIDEFTASSIPVDDDATRRPLLTITHSPGTNHNAGQLQFGPDDYLYISTGDGGGTPNLAQDTSSLLGKILRIDPDPSPPEAYSSPPGNPFLGVAGADEIWSYGFRNPFRFSFDRTTGALLIGDVGGANAEEVDYAPPPDGGQGVNFGWPCREGFGAGPNASCSGLGGFTNPIHDYSHSSGNCSITGGYVVRDPGLGSLVGRYLYADFCSGQVRSLVPGLPQASCDRSENLNVVNPSTFGEDSSGRIYVASLTTGTVFRLAGDSTATCPSSPPPPPPDPPPSPGSGPAPQPEPTADEPEPTPDGPPGPSAPTLRIGARSEQRLDGDRRLVAVIRSDQSTEAVSRLALLAGGDVLLRPDEKRLDLEPDTDQRVGWKLSRADLRSLRRPLRDGRLEARFRARPLDAAGEPGPRVETVSALRD